MVKRRLRRPRSGAVKRSPRKRGEAGVAPPLGAGESEVEPITAFMENAGAMWPTPDSLDDAAVTADQSGVEEIRGKEPEAGNSPPRGSRAGRTS